MKPRKITLTPERLDTLMADLRAVSDTPAGDHLSDDDIIDYAAEALAPDEVARLDAHLTACTECAIKVERLVEASEIWRGEQGEAWVEKLGARARMNVRAPDPVSIGEKTSSRLREMADSFRRWWDAFGKTRGSFNPTQYQQIICDITRDLLGKLAPHELALFLPISEAYFSNPQRVLAGRRYKEDMLGFGLETGPVLWTPATLAVVTELVQSLAVPGETPSLRLSPEHLAKVRERAFERACELKLPEPQARALADGLVERLTVTD